ncbi:hypothetical protein EYF80_068023 [Liparis tanakae]|uniref:Uncharacterized protein n=1 Tax=Liparis tanakae TaxID=230148 RepID=A0A4Z2DZB0_9TELE|nr:hypothetical protein EYF80_068023 [Liparis tanakae]
METCSAPQKDSSASTERRSYTPSSAYTPRENWEQTGDTTSGSSWRPLIGPHRVLLEASDWSSQGPPGGL